MIGFLLMLGCIPLTPLVPPHPAAPTQTIIVRPDRTWTTRPLPCDYSEVGTVSFEGWNRGAAHQELNHWFGDGPADAIADYSESLRVVTLPVFGCDEIPGCTLNLNGYTATATIWTVTGLAVKWVGDCPL